MSDPSPDKIPIVDLRAQYGKLRDELREAIDEVVESQQFILGPAVTRFEAQMANYLQCSHAVGVASGSDALLLALMALEIGPGDAVITTPFTFFSTVSSITRLGAAALFVDIDAGNYLLSAEALKQFLSEHTNVRDGVTIEIKTGRPIKALLPVHLFGQCCAMNEFLALTKQYPMAIVEDVAQACGARLEINSELEFAGNIGALGCFSFFPSKTLGGFGDGGLVSGNSIELAERLRMLRMHGESAKYHHELTGINSRLDSLQAAVLTVKLAHLESWCAERIQRADNYFRLFNQSGILGPGILAIPPASKDMSHVFNNYVIRAERRDQLRAFLTDHGVQSEIYYPLPLHRQKCFADLGYQAGDFPNAELAASQVLALPLYPELSAGQQETVVARIGAFYRR
ncbi:MAG: DegT/DnrJ/EryC1/StrS family aminotransferase [Deltaproteobacteria bacterium]|nr:DegT/DnrJ/EryC1/StrS family aminotransferase [Deltaproteobacteria bacterium]